METCDVLVVGGGPAGASCARTLVHAGLDVVLMDRAVFPRDKVCAGWITPRVLETTGVDRDDYRRGRTLQEITAFRTGIIGGDAEVEIAYGEPVSFGIRRSEFDEYLLRRSGARLRLGTPVSRIRRDGERWVINERITAGTLVGAGGHFCPVARWLNPRITGAPLVVAQEAEFRIEAGTDASYRVVPGTPEFYFCRDLKGYGWCVRKEEYLNIGLGRLDERSLPQATAEFVAYLRARGRIPAGLSCRWRGHAYLVSDPPRRRVTGPGVLLVGDAAGLAYPQSGEGIWPAIESGMLAALTVIEAAGDCTSARLEPYVERLHDRLGLRSSPRVFSGVLRDRIAAAFGPWLLTVPSFVRHVVLDRWFLGVKGRGPRDAAATAPAPCRRAARRRHPCARRSRRAGPCAPRGRRRRPAP